jgi:hypothetical protein
MGFKLGNEKRKYHTPQNTPIIKKELEPGIQAEANNDGTIFVDHKLQEGTRKYNVAIKHEMQHMNDMASGRAQYGDDWVMWEDKIYIRKEVDGEKVIDGPAGRLPEGHPDHPWEQAAIEAENE